jgi:predicted PurR-regulated permease PerM
LIAKFLAVVRAPVKGSLLVAVIQGLFGGIVFWFLVAHGIFAIGLANNLLRPMLVGKDARMPDYVVMITTLGGMATFGNNGFII